MSTAPEGLEFSTVIASTVHDMKNSLALLTQTHSQWLTQLPEALLHNREHGITPTSITPLMTVAADGAVQVSAQVSAQATSPTAFKEELQRV